MKNNIIYIEEMNEFLRNNNIGLRWFDIQYIWI